MKMSPNVPWLEANAGKTVRLDCPRATYDVTVEEVTDD